ncbi:MAG: hypothetical protein ACLVJH_17370 [Faecalibacterium prausnitzii]
MPTCSRVYSTEPALYDGEYNPDCFEWVASESRSRGRVRMAAQGPRARTCSCVMNTQDHAHKKFPLYLRFPCSAEEVLNTESAEWGGALRRRRKTEASHHRWRCVRSGLYPYGRPARHGQLLCCGLRRRPRTRMRPASAPTKPLNAKRRAATAAQRPQPSSNK